MTTSGEKALRPEDLTRLFVERANAGDAEGVALLYEKDAVIAYPPNKQTVGRAAIQALWEKVLAGRPHFAAEDPLLTLISGDLALTSTPPKDKVGARAQYYAARPTAAGYGYLTNPSSPQPVDLPELPLGRTAS